MPVQYFYSMEKHEEQKKRASKAREADRRIRPKLKKTCVNTLTSRNTSKKRPGKPKRDWTVDKAKLFWTRNQNALPQHLKGQDLDLTKDEHRQAIRTAAKTAQNGHTTKQTIRTYQPARARQGGGDHSRRLNPFGQTPFV